MRASSRRGMRASAEILPAVALSPIQAMYTSALNAYRPSLPNSSLKPRTPPERAPYRGFSYHDRPAITP